MKHIVASWVVVAAAAVVAAATTPAIAQTADSNGTSKRDCAIGHVTGVGGSEQSFREYLASSTPYRYLTENPFQCRDVSPDSGRASNCTGVTNLRNERVSVYDDNGDGTMSVVTRMDLDQGTYPVIVVVRKQDVRCEE